MKAQARDLNFLGNEGIIRVPFFQRPYVWTLENWRELLEDLSDTSRPHFLGSLILKQLDRSVGDHNAVLVIDGQQRLTTLSVLLKALYDTLPADVRPDALTALRPLLFYRRTALDSRLNVKLEHSRLDREVYQKVVRAGIDGPEVPADTKHLVADAYRFFVQDLSTWSVDERKQLFNHLLDPDNRMLVVIDLDQQDNEQGIFDTINSAGVRLSGADIVKNALYQRAIQLIGEGPGVDLYQATWEKTFLNEESVAFWDEERVSSRKRRDNLEILLNAVAIAMGIHDLDKPLSQVPNRYKELFASFSSGEQVKSFANDLCEYARLYREYFVVHDSTTLYSFDEPVTRLLHLLDTFKIASFDALVLHVLRHRTPEDAERILHQLERFVVRRIVAGQETRSLNRFAKDFIQDPTKLDTRIDETSDRDVAIGLRNVSNYVAKAVLFWIELGRRRDPRHDVRELHYVYSLEHVMPQKWETHWGVPAVDERGAPVDAVLAGHTRQQHVYWIGNMTLLNQSLNTSLRNDPFKNKVEGDTRRPGMRRFATLSITKEIVDQQTWDERAIAVRTAHLEAEFLALWPGAARVAEPV